MPPILFFHGLESSPAADKAVLLHDAFGAFTPDFSGMILVDRLEKGATIVAELREPVLMVGSSLGGLMAVHLAAQFPEKCAGLVLFAPAVWPEMMPGIEALPGRIRVLHGVDDEVVPIGVSRDFAARFGAALEEVADTHRLERSYDRLLALVREALAEIEREAGR